MEDNVTYKQLQNQNQGEDKQQAVYKIHQEKMFIQYNLFFRNQEKPEEISLEQANRLTAQVNVNHLD